MQPLISIIVPVYNVEKYLNKCVESIVNQTYKNLEIILVDDGSTDNCPRICDEWAEKDSRIKVIHKQNGGVSSARNAGLDNAAGEYIAFVDSDDYIKNDMYEKLYNALMKYNADVSICNMFSYNRSLILYPEMFSKKPDILSLYLSDVLCSPGIPGKLYKKSIIQSVRFDTSKKISEDYLFNYHVFKKAENAVAIKDELYCYFNREDSAVNNLDEDMINRWEVTKHILENEPLNESEYQILLNKYAHELLCILRELIKSKNKELINRNFYKITDEIKFYSNQFYNTANIGRFAKLSVKLLCVNPYLFKFMYSLFLLFRKGNR